MNKRKMEEKKKDYDFDQRLAELKEEEERAKEYKKEKRKVLKFFQIYLLLIKLRIGCFIYFKYTCCNHYNRKKNVYFVC